MSSAEQRVLVAGATGYLGGFVAKEFSSRGNFVRALARSLQRLDHMRGQIDEVVRGDVTKRESIQDICDTIDIVFSSVGITRQVTNLTFKDVDYQGNKNLLQIAQKAGVKKFIYVSVFNGQNLLHLDIVKAHEDFVDALKASGINYAIIRPTGYFSDMSEFLSMAKRGRIYLFGTGDNKINPIHGADLAKICVDAMEGERQEIDVGGPGIFTWREIAELALKAQGRSGKISTIPVWLARSAAGLTRVFSKHKGELLAFFITMMTTDVVAPPTGTHTLKAFYQECVRQETTR